MSADWDLGPLVDGDGGAGAERLLAEAVKRAGAFAEAHAGRITQLDADGLARAMTELAAIRDLAGRAQCYAELRFATDTGDQACGAFLQFAQERVAEINMKLVFFELEWTALPADRADALLAAAGEDPDFPAHHLHRLGRRKSHLLSEPEERILAELRVPSRAAWQRQYNELLASVQVDLDGEQLTVEAVFARLELPDREARRAASEALTAALTPSLRMKAFTYNTLMHEKAIDDRLRSYPDWLSSHNLANEASDRSVDAMIDVVLAGRELAQRWYRLKARLLGLERLADYDLPAPLLADDAVIAYGEARELVLAAYTSFSPQAAAVVRRFFEERWIDARPRPGKASGAFCEYTVPSVHPYVLLNYNARRRDVLVMAHELGHGLHGALAQPRRVFQQMTPHTFAETASVFGETLVFEELLSAAVDDRDRLSLLGLRLDTMIRLIFQWVAANRFEHEAHTHRRSDGELSAEDLSTAWVEAISRIYGDSVELTERYRIWWSYFPHFANEPGSSYAYAYGQLLALSAYARYREVGAPFVPDFLAMLAAGGSCSPEQLGQMIGIDVADPAVWDAGLELVNEQLDTAEALAFKLPTV
ncbi:MAG: M3 family oligoendopeptidase [Actinomycetota bacterium]|nr:M3 family oligoendopeptidase [Actinomycetota bacterium]